MPAGTGPCARRRYLLAMLLPVLPRGCAAGTQGEGRLAMARHIVTGVSFGDAPPRASLTMPCNLQALYYNPCSDVVPTMKEVRGLRFGHMVFLPYIHCNICQCYICQGEPLHSHQRRGTHYVGDYILHVHFVQMAEAMPVVQHEIKC